MSLVINSYLFPTRSWVKNSINNGIKILALSGEGKIQYGSNYFFNESLYKSTDSGKTWNSLGIIQPWIEIKTSYTGQYVLAITAISDNIYISNDYGQTWVLTAITATWTSIAISENGQIQYATNSDAINGKVYKSTNYGLSWTPIPEESFRPLSSAQNIKTTSDGSIALFWGLDDDPSTHWYKYNNTTSTLSTLPWNALNNPVSFEISGNAQYITIVYGNGSIGVSSDGGQTFIGFSNFQSLISTGQPAISTNGKIQVILGDSSSGLNSIVYVSFNYGINWLQSPTRINGRLYNSEISSNGKILSITDTGGNVYTNSNFGY
jgi:photosystem II stability/assembly factor-like uncharacterized protein